MGTGPFAAPTFRELYRTYHDIVALVTSPLHLRPGHEPPPINIVRDVAHQHTTPIFDPEEINTRNRKYELSKYSADLMVVCDYGQIWRHPLWPLRNWAVLICMPHCCQDRGSPD